MKVGKITITSDICLVEPDIARDAPRGVQWLEGNEGRRTLRLMGVAEESNTDSTIEKERARVEGFINDADHLNWMISYRNRIVGAVWVDVVSTEQLPGPSVHIMIGDQKARNKGIGSAVLKAVLEYLAHERCEVVYSRYMTANDHSRALLFKLGFGNIGATYFDDGVEFQNAMKHF